MFRPFKFRTNFMRKIKARAHGQMPGIGLTGASGPAYPADAVHINTAWLNGKTAPYQLGTPDDPGDHSIYYVLDQDITVDHCAFYTGFSASNPANEVTLDLNGHTITYNNATPPAVPNGSFEDTDLSNWTIPGGFSRANSSAVNKYLFSTWYLTGTTASQVVIVSDAVNLVANRQYSAWAVVKSNNDTSTGLIEIIRSSDSAVLATGPTQTALNRGFYPICDFHVTVSETVKVRLTLTPTSSDTFVVDQVSIDHAWNSAIRNGLGDWEPFEPWHYQQLSGWTSVCSRTYKLKITDSTVTGNASALQQGAIIQGKWGRCCHALDVESVWTSLTITGIRIEVQGIDGLPIWEYGGEGSATIQRNYIKFNTNSQVSRRMGVICGNSVTNGTRYQSAAVQGTVTTSLTVSSNTIVNCPQVAVGISSTGSSSYTKLFHSNTITMRGNVSDPYAFSGNGVGPIRIYNNTVGVASDRKSGRGIIMACQDNLKVNTDIEIYGNTFNLREVYNLEYQGSGIECAGFRLRNYSNTGVTQSGIKFHDNNITVRTAGGEETAQVYGIRILINDGVDYDCGLEIYDNTVTAITESASAQAHAIDLDCMDSTASGVRIYQNTAISNHHSFCVGSGDAYQIEAAKAMFMCNTSVKSGEYGGLVTYRSFTITDDTAYPNGIYLIHHTYDATDTDINWVSANWPAAWNGTVYEGWKLNVYGPTAGATVTIKDASANTLYSVTADANGDALNIPGPTQRRNYPKGGPESGATTLTPLTVWYDAQSQLVTPTADQDVTFT